MKKYFYIIAIAALGITACNEVVIETTAVQPASEAPVCYVNIPASMGVGTKAVEFGVDGMSVNSTFDNGAPVYVVLDRMGDLYIGHSGEGGDFTTLTVTVDPLDATKATLSGALKFVRPVGGGSATPAYDDILYMYYGVNSVDSSTGDICFDYMQQDGSISNSTGAGSCDFAQATMKVLSKSGNADTGYTLTLGQVDNLESSTACFENIGSMFRQRLSFTNGGYPMDPYPSALRYLQVTTEGESIILQNRLYSSSSAPGPIATNDMVFYGNPITPDVNGDVYFALAFDTPPTGTLSFRAADTNGNYYSGSKSLPAGGLQNRNYYYGNLGLAFSYHKKMPFVTDTNSNPVWANINDVYYLRDGGTVSGDSEEFQVNLLYPGTVTLTGNGTATKFLGPFIRNMNFTDGDLDVILGSDYSIDCSCNITAISTAHGDLKLATTGSSQTLTVSVGYKPNKGLAGTNYTGSEPASALAADGFTVTLADPDPDPDKDGIFTFVYTVAPTTP